MRAIAGFGADEATAVRRTAELPRRQAGGDANTLPAVPLLAVWEPIGHRPPMPRINDVPYTPAPVSNIPENVLQQIEQIDEMMRKKNGDRIWEFVVQSAGGTGS